MKTDRVIVIFSDESYRSFFFIKNITGNQIQYSVRMEQDDLCVLIMLTALKRPVRNFKAIQYIV